jgi:hypothetical protein
MVLAALSCQGRRDSHGLPVSFVQRRVGSQDGVPFRVRSCTKPIPGQVRPSPSLLRELSGGSLDATGGTATECALCEPRLCCSRIAGPLACSVLRSRIRLRMAAKLGSYSPGCSVAAGRAAHPGSAPRRTAQGAGFLSWNYDFSYSG